MSLSVKAAAFANWKHWDQKRKYTGEPYFNHCAEVAELVRSIGGTEEMIAAAYLHDTVEDTATTLEEIGEIFGWNVQNLVGWLTDVSKPRDGNRAMRKQIDREHTSQATPEAKTIKLADLISNSRSIVERDPDFAKVYLKEKELLMPFLLEGNPTLFAKALEFIGSPVKTNAKDDK